MQPNVHRDVRLVQFFVAPLVVIIRRRLLRAAGYTGSLTQLKVFVRHIRPQPAPEPIVRFETPSGHQAQVDWARCPLPWGVRWGLFVVLGVR
jgi:transposase